MSAPQPAQLVIIYHIVSIIVAAVFITFAIIFVVNISVCHPIRHVQHKKALMTSITHKHPRKNDTNQG